MRAVVALVVVALCVWTPNGEVRDLRGSSHEHILTVDCNGGVHLFQNSIFEANFNLENIKDLVNEYGDELKDTAKCACPSASDAELQRRFVPSLEAFLSTFSHVQVSQGQYQVETSVLENSCASGQAEEPIFRMMFNGIIDSNNGLNGFSFPSTCTYNSVASGKGCQFKVSGSSDGLLKNTLSSFNVVADKCDGSSVWPFIEITCEGVGCRNWLIPTCAQSSDCGGEGRCAPFINDADIKETLLGTGLFSNETIAGCFESQVPSRQDLLVASKARIAQDIFDISPDTLTCTSLDDILDGIILRWNEFLDLFSDQVSEENGGQVVSEESVPTKILNFLQLFVPSLDGTLSFVTSISSVGLAQDAKPTGFDEAACAARGCHPSYLGNGYCDPDCNVPECLFDGNECLNCACVQGSDTSSCDPKAFYRETSGLNQLVDAGFYAPTPRRGSVPEACDVFQQATPPPFQQWEPASTGCTLQQDSAQPADWFCTISTDGVVEDETLLASANQVDCTNEITPKIRTCRCAFPADPSTCSMHPLNPSPFSFGRFVTSETACANPKPQERCPVYTLETSVSSKMAPLELAFYDKLGLGFEMPSTAMEAGSFFHTSCAGDVILRVLHEKLTFAFSFPGMPKILSTIEDAFGSFDACMHDRPANTKSTVDFRLGSALWRPEFFLGLLTSPATLETLGRDTSREDLGNRFNLGSQVLFPNVPALNLETFLSDRSVRAEFKAFADLFSLTKELTVAVDISKCASSSTSLPNVLSEFSLAVISPVLEKTFSGVLNCTDVVEDSCGNDDFICADFLSILSDMFQEAGGLSEIQAALLASWVWGERSGISSEFNPFPTCLPDSGSRVMSLIQTLLQGFLLGKDQATLEQTKQTLPVEKWLLACVPEVLSIVGQIFEEGLFECTLPGIPFDARECSGEDASECEVSTFPQHLCNYSNTFEQLQTPSCGQTYSQEARCDSMVCMYVPPTLGSVTILQEYNSRFVYSSESNTEVLQSAQDACFRDCNFDTMSQFGFPGLESGGSFSCSQKQACEDLGGSFKCLVNTPLNVQIGVEVSLVPLVGACGPRFPYAFGPNSNKCCNINPGSLSYENRALQDENWCDINGGKSFPCGTTCTDSFAAEPALPGTCYYPPILSCDNAGRSSQLMTWKMPEQPEQQQVVRYPSLVHCQDACATQYSGAETCTCVAIVEPECVETPRAQCSLLADPGYFFTWKDQTVQTADQQVSIPTLLTRTSSVPGPLFDVPPPSISSVVMNSNGNGFIVTFSKSTNEFLPLSQSCANILRVQGAEDGKHVCEWFSPKELAVFLEKGSQLPTQFSVNMLQGNGIKSLLGVSTDAVGSFIVDLSNFGTEMIVDVQVPQVISVCNPLVEVVVTVLAGFGLDDPLVSVSVVNAINERMVEVIDSPESRFVFNVSTFPVPSTFDVSIQVKNSFGQSIEVFKTVSYTSEQVPDVTVLGSDTRSISLGLDSLNLRAVTSYFCQVDALLGGSFQYSWRWAPAELTRIGLNVTGEWNEIVLKASEGSLTLDPNFFQLPGTYAMEVEVALSTDQTVASKRIVAVDVALSPLSVVVLGGNDRTLYASEAIPLDGSKSCDPNIVSSCNPTFGYTGTTTGVTLLSPTAQIGWTCEILTAFPDTWSACRLSLPSELSIEIPANTLEAGNDYRFTLNIDGESSTPVRVWIVPEPPLINQCTIIPQISVKPVPSVVNAVNGLVLTSVVSGYVPGSQSASGISLQWELVQNVEFINGTRVVTTSSAAPFSDVTNREALFIKAGKLLPGRTYTFRVSAVQSCTAPQHPYSEVTFSVNRPPQGGSISATPTSGRAFLDEFEFLAGDFFDLDSIEALEYAFEYSFKAPQDGQVISATDLYPLSSFSLSPVLRTTLELPWNASTLNEGSVFVFAVAKDKLGAVSRRDHFVEVKVRDPSGDVVVDDIDVDKEIREALIKGETGDALLRVALSLASLSNAVTDSSPAWAQSTANKVLQSLSLIDFNPAVSRDPVLLSMQMNVLLTLVSNPVLVEADPSFANASVSLLTDLVSNARTLLDLGRVSSDDPSAIDILPESLTANALETVSEAISNTLRAFRAATGRRRLEAAQTACSLSTNARDTIKQLASLVLQGYPEGAAARSFSAQDIQFSVGVENPNALGSQNEGGDGLTTLSLPPASNRQGKSGGEASSSSKSNARGYFVLPPSVLNGEISNGDSSPSQVTVLAVSFAFDVRCESVVFQVEQSECDGNVSAILEWEGPVSEVEDVVSLDFFETSNTDRTFDPQNLEEGNEIIIAVPRSKVFDEGVDVCGNSSWTEPVCGYFSPEKGEWSQEGCQVAAEQSSEDVLICQCNHASDYSAWTSFREDVRSTFSNPITAVTSIAILVLGVLFPSLFVAMVIGMFWARRRDQVESDTIQKGAIGMLYLRRIQLRSKQKVFFDKLRDLKKSNEKMEDLLKETASRVEHDSLEREKAKKRRNWCTNLYLALKYEHSLISLFSRYDPVYSRTQRVAVFFAVVVGNLLAAAFFFELKNSDDISFGFLVGVVFMASLMVAIPVRFCVKLLFRTSDTKRGTKGERVKNIYRIASKLHDDMPQEGVDLDLVMAYKNLYLAKQRLEVAKRKRAEQKAGRRASDESSMALAAVVIESDGDEPSTGAAQGEKEDGEGTERQQEFAAKKKASIFSAGNADAATDEVKQAAKDVKEAKTALWKATQAAQDAWGSSSTEEAIQRINRIKRQKSVLLKVTALMADEPTPRAKSRKALLSHKMRYVGYFVLLAFWALAGFYITRFVLTRGGDRTAEEENQIILIWLGTAALGVFAGYLIAEPLVMAIRYAILPWILTRFGSGDDSKTLSDAYEEEKEEGLNALSGGQKRGSTEEKHMYAKEKKLAGEEQGAESAKSMFIWELATDLIESGI